MYWGAGHDSGTRWNAAHEHHARNLVFHPRANGDSIVIAGHDDLEFDEAHYWMWSERLAPAYFSKGPGVAFVMRASTAIFGANEFGVRFFSPILAAGTSLLLFYFARRLFNATAAMWSVIALNVTPIFNIGAFLMTIDPLSIFFWLAAMFTFWLAVEKSAHFSWQWPLSGLLIGLGFLSKYTNALELVSVVLVLALAPRLRHEFKRPGLYSLIALFALCTVPPIVWNAQHAWITLGASAFARRSRTRFWNSFIRAAGIFGRSTFSLTRRCSFWRWPGASSQAGVA